jgi:hypothetical protein
MISVDYPLASWFLVVCSLFFLLVVALPLLFVPLTWARWFRWKLPEGSTDLTVYFGRCLGGTALAIIVAVAHGIPDPKSHHLMFELVGVVSALMIFIHLWGAIRKIQPLSETVEIAVWVVVSIIAFWLRYSVLA